MAWTWLIIAGLCEIIWAAGLKKFGFTFTSLGGIGTIVVMILSFVLLAQAMKSIPLGTCYAAWVGIGAAGTLVYGIVALGESADWKRLACAAILLAGIVGLKVVEK